jgi:hypothetical protein
MLAIVVAVNKYGAVPDNIFVDLMAISVNKKA